MERVTGIGGVFFRSRDPDALVAWYVEHLGVEQGEGGSVLFRGEAGVEVEDKTEDHEYGRFGWARDPEGNRIELWEPAPDS